MIIELSSPFVSPVCGEGSSEKKNKAENDYPVVIASTEQSKPHNASFDQMPLKRYIYQKSDHYNLVWFQ